MCYELNRMIPIDFLVTAGNHNERKALLKILVEGVTYMEVSGYGAFYVYHTIIHAKAHFIIRIKTNLLFIKQESKKSNYLYQHNIYFER